MTVSTAPEARADSPGSVLLAARGRRRAADAAEAELLCLAVDWSVMHPPESIHDAATHTLRGFGQTDLAISGPGAPTVAEFSVAEFAAAVGLSTEAGKRYLGEAVELRYRLPRLWERVTAGDLAAWKARLVARETIQLSTEAASYVDRHVAHVAHKIRPAQLERLVAEAIGRFMPEEAARVAAEAADGRHVTIHDQLVSFEGTMRVEAELDLADALDLEAAVAAGAEHRALCGSTETLDVRRAQAVGDLARRQLSFDLMGGDPTPRRTKRQVLIHVHLSEAAILGDDPVAHLERGNALVTADQVRAWCGNQETQIVVKPVLDLGACVEVDSDVVPDRLAEQVALRDRTCVFPWCTRPARRCHPDSTDHPCDDDHVHPRSRGGPYVHLQPRSALPETPSAQDPLPVELSGARPRHLPLDQSPRLPVPPRPFGHPRRESGPTAPARPTRPLTTPPRSRPPTVRSLMPVLVAARAVAARCSADVSGTTTSNCLRLGPP